MRRQLDALLVGGALLAGAGTAPAHHSFAMFDQEHPIELEGTVQEFKFTAPHAFIILAVKQEDGRLETWSLEGVSPSALVREGWSRATLKPGDELKLIIAPLRSGAPGGAWVTQKIHFRDGKPVVLSP
jgi:Family of unknown function (DUF6152)